MKYGLIIAISYCQYEENIKISPLQGTYKDLEMMVEFCINKNITCDNITIITDLITIPENCIDKNVKKIEFASCFLMCKEICEFVENNIRNTSETPEIFIYFSCHGSKLKIISDNNILDDEAIVLKDFTGSYLRFIRTKDIFNMLFGRYSISEDGIITIPTYKKCRKIIRDKMFRKECIVGVVENIQISMKVPVESPEEQFNNFTRSSYLKNRGIPYNSKVLIIIDCCYSGRMLSFPYLFENFELVKINNKNLDTEDVAYCVCISSCESNKSTRSENDGSLLTKLIFNKLLKIREPLIFSDIYNILKIENFNPIISSTVDIVENYIPFFDLNNIKKPRKIFK